MVWRNLQSIKEKPIEDLLLGIDFWKHLTFHHQWLQFPQLSVCFALFGLHCSVDTPPSRNPPSLFAYFFNADVSKDGRFQDPSTPTNEPAKHPINLSFPQMGLSENSVPLHPMVNDHYPNFQTYPNCNINASMLRNAGCESVLFVLTGTTCCSTSHSSTGLWNR